jgi:hypothetical protein
MDEPIAARSPQPATIEDLQAIVACIEEFWGDRETAGLHQALYIHEFGDTALVIRDDEGRVLAYLLGFSASEVAGYSVSDEPHGLPARAGLSQGPNPPIGLSN